MREYSKFYDLVYSKHFKFEANGWIQWKGTGVCIDLHCPCGFHGHADADFFYYYKCKCGKKYAVGQVVKLIEISEEESKLADLKDDDF